MIRLGTRGSALALAQAKWVAERLPGEVEIVPIRTTGDQPSEKGQTPLGGLRVELEDKSRFVKELEEALLRGGIELAVHSAKDVPAELPGGLSIVAVPERADPRDALCGANTLDELAEGAVVGTASLRRRAALLALRPDLDVRDLRGNVDTRLRRLAEGDFDAIVLAHAGLERLGRPEEGAPLDATEFIPAAGQGCLVLEARTEDRDAAEAASHLTDPDALAALTAERALVHTLGATCHTPVGAHTPANGAAMRLVAFVGLPDGSRWIRDELDGDPGDPATLGAAVAERLLLAGAAELLGTPPG
ncbi:MAG TPA: hydroxymethylbilane synthase [Thermoleophilaceae bacterium]